ncbi:MAG: hypothetical protein HY318_06675 [Armatimonadetes bacterium]|nr:hypothetical protein [Armatimonadota bacterium]
MREIDSDIDWLDLCLPLETLDDNYDPGGEFYSKPRWREPIAEWLAEIGQQVYRVVPFRLGLLGVEVSGETHARQLSRAYRTENGMAIFGPLTKTWFGIR